MKIVGLTGSIGMGKSTVAGMLRDLGVPVFDADAEVHRLQSADGALVKEIEAAFPGTTGFGVVDRPELGGRVFDDDAAMARLEAIVHPAVARARADFLIAHEGDLLVVFDIPLLFEKDSHVGLQAVWVVSAPAAVQRARVLSRPGMTSEKFDAIVSRQIPDAQKRARATAIIDTGETLDEPRAQVAALVACMTAR